MRETDIFEKFIEKKLFVREVSNEQYNSIILKYVNFSWLDTRFRIAETDVHASLQIRIKCFKILSFE